MLQTLIGEAASIERLQQIMDEMSAKARKRGLTDERLDELLNEQDYIVITGFAMPRREKNTQ